MAVHGLVWEYMVVRSGVYWCIIMYIGIVKGEDPLIKILKANVGFIKESLRNPLEILRILN